jgi:hypothetical protein
MSPAMSIQYMQRKDIDDDKWNKRIENSVNGLLYGYTYYLDHMSDNWDALVLGDYEALMPLPWRKKYGIRYIYQPFLCAQLGVFGEKAGQDLSNSFIENIPSHFRLAEIPMNSLNGLPRNCHLRKNYLLDLSKSYDAISQNYNENTARNIRRSSQSGGTAAKNCDVEQVIALAIGQMRTGNREISQNVQRFRKLFSLLQGRNSAMTYCIRSGDNNILSSAVFFFSHNRAYYILVGNHPDGRELGSSHALIDAFIQDQAGKQIFLDFEGSDIPSLAFFYSGFGAVVENYAALKLNRLPFLLRWMKK